VAKVSIIMCVYNGEAYLEKAIESVLNQTYSNFELVIVDDGSTDSTSSILSTFAAQDSRILLMHNKKNYGLEHSLNIGLTAAQGEYIARQDADDISLPERLELQAQFLDSHPQIGALYTAVEFISDKGIVLGEDHPPEDHESLKALLLVNNFMHHSSLMTRLSLIKAVGGYDETKRYAEDYDLWWKLSRLSRLSTLPQILLRRRLDNGSRISNLYRRQQLECSFNISWKAVRESLGDNESYLDKTAYRKWWWSYLRTIDDSSYVKFWSKGHGSQKSCLTVADIENLRPFWNLLTTYPGGSRVWGQRLLCLVNDLFRRKQYLVGLRLLSITAHQMKVPISLYTLFKSIVRPYLPSLRKLSSQRMFEKSS
jgi:glycosyltransferase involved in cell wall biosynthesis